MTVWTPKKLVTFEEFCRGVAEGQKADLIDGVVYMASPDNTEANVLFVWLQSLLDWYVEYKGLGRVFGSRVSFRLGKHQAPEPDVAFVRNDRLHLVQPGYVDGAPDLAIEIVSPESVERDYEKKRKQYQNAEVPEYWIVDEIMGKVTQLSLNARGKYREIRAKDGVVKSVIVPGFWVRADWLLAVPRPIKHAVFSELIAE
jgi:Uma2 family endonuclease